MTWTDVIAVEGLRNKAGKAVVRAGGRQILLLETDRGLFACANRCPHQGYPLSEGILTDGCVLTCNWHNWKFDLDGGETLIGGDRLRRFPVRIEADRVLVDLSPEDPTEVRTRILAGLSGALKDADQERLVREAARLVRLCGDGAAAVAYAVDWSAERLEFGMTHAHAAAPDWLALHDARASKPDEKLAAIGEILGHIAEDAQGGGRFPYPAGEAPWSEAEFLAAVEDEDEGRAIALTRGALAAGLTAANLAPTLGRAALAHYADFGHSLIYAVKTEALIARLGPATDSPLLNLLVRSMVYARREDLLPEFRTYAAELAVWGGTGASGNTPFAATSLRGRSARRAMAIVVGWSAKRSPQAIFEVLVEAAAWTLLHVDGEALVQVDRTIADNVGWLDFTHALTFADAGAATARRSPELWPAVLLQLACFLGRNAAYVDADLDTRPFAVADACAFSRSATGLIFDHGHAGFIISCHLIKTQRAAERLAALAPDAAPMLAAAMNRFLNAPVKRRHVLRTARQMRAFVAQE